MRDRPVAGAALAEVHGVSVADITEKQWDAQVRELCRMLGWRRYHTLRSKGSPSGYPDLTLVRDRVVFIELKTEKGKLSDRQRDWLEALLNAGAEAYVARPSDLQAVSAVLHARHRVHGDLSVRTRQALGVYEEAA